MFELIQPNTSVDQIVKNYPESLKVLYLFHVDVCCEGSKSLQEVAREKGFVAEDLIDALKESLRVRAMPFAS